MATWKDRNAQARAAGYRNYYDYRVHGYGKTPSSQDVSGEQLARARGHRSQADLERDIGPGDVLSVWTYGPRDREGRYRWVDFHVSFSDGTERIYRLRGGQITVDRLDTFVDHVGSSGAVISPAPSLDVRTLLEDLQEMEEEYYGEDEE